MVQAHPSVVFISGIILCGKCLHFGTMKYAIWMSHNC